MAPASDLAQDGWRLKPGGPQAARSVIDLREDLPLTLTIARAVIRLVLRILAPAHWNPDSDSSSHSQDRTPAGRPHAPTDT